MFNHVKPTHGDSTYGHVICYYNQKGFSKQGRPQKFFIGVARQGQLNSWGGTQNYKSVTDFQELFCHCVIDGSYVRVKESYVDILWFVILQ